MTLVAIWLQGSHFDCFPGPNIEKIHAGSRSGTLTGNLGSGTTGVGAWRGPRGFIAKGGPRYDRAAPAWMVTANVRHQDAKPR
jgi:hypothetical protein